MIYDYDRRANSILCFGSRLGIGAPPAEKLLIDLKTGLHYNGGDR